MLTELLSIAGIVVLALGVVKWLKGEDEGAPSQLEMMFTANPVRPGHVRVVMAEYIEDSGEIYSLVGDYPSLEEAVREAALRQEQVPEGRRISYYLFDEEGNPIG